MNENEKGTQKLKNILSIWLTDKCMWATSENDGGASSAAVNSFIYRKMVWTIIKLLSDKAVTTNALLIKCMYVILIYYYTYMFVPVLDPFLNKPNSTGWHKS